MFRLSCEVTIGDFVFDKITNATIESSWKNLTDTAEITLPKNLKLGDKALEKLIKTGQPVVIKLGYDFENVTEFKGYVTSISPRIPYVIKCEDEMFMLKKNPITKHYTSVNLKTLIADILPTYKTAVLDIELGDFVLNSATPAQVLQALDSSYGIKSFFQDDVLHVGFAYPKKVENIYYDFTKNVISETLDYAGKEDKKIKVTAYSLLHNNKKIEVTVGDHDGEEVKMPFANISDKSTLKMLANNELSRLKVDGVKGGITTWGIPFSKHGMAAYIIDPEYPEKQGAYFIDKVNLTYGQGGFRRTNTLGSKITA